MFLENAKRVGLTDMIDGPVQIIGSREAARQVGIGYAAAKGWALYRGNGEFEITQAGHEALAAILNPTE